MQLAVRTVVSNVGFIAALASPSFAQAPTSLRFPRPLAGRANTSAVSDFTNRRNARPACAKLSPPLHERDSVA